MDNNKLAGQVLTDYLSFMSLSKLHLVRNKLTDAQAGPLAGSIKQSRDLESVFMSHNEMSNEALGMMADAFALNTNIEQISITHNDLSLVNG